MNDPSSVQFPVPQDRHDSVLPSRVSIGSDTNGDGHPPIDNDRRLALIDKKLSVGLSATEMVELDQLDAQMTSYVDSIFPLPFDMLEFIRTGVRKAGASSRPSADGSAEQSE